MPKRPLTETQRLEYGKVAYLYYKEKLTQDEIGTQMHMSRQRVNRILKESLEEGIVRIIVEYPGSGSSELEKKLLQKYHLRHIQIVANARPENIYTDLGEAAGAYLASIVKEGDTIGFTRGQTLSVMAEVMKPVVNKNLTVVQLMGSRNNVPQNTASNQIVVNFARKLNARLVAMLAPITVGSPELKANLLKEPSFQETYQTLKICNIAVVGIGAGASLKRMQNLFPDKELADILQMEEEDQVAGEIGTHMFDFEGRVITNRLRNRIIAAELPDLKKIPVRLGVAGLPKKVKAIHGALVGDYVNDLIIDNITAEILEKL
jgi:deoxyribonucleoside regulator